MERLHLCNILIYKAIYLFNLFINPHVHQMLL